MPRSPLQVRYTLTILTLVTVAVVTLATVLSAQSRNSAQQLTVLTAVQMEQRLIAQLQDRGESMVRLLGANLVNPLYEYDMQSMYELTSTTLHLDEVLYVYIVGPRGELIHDGTEELRRFGDLPDDALTTAAVAAERLLIQQASDHIDFALPLAIGDERLGTVRLGLPLSTIAGDVAEVRDRLRAISETGARRSLITTAWTMGAMLMLALLLAVVVSRNLVRPIKQLSQCAERIGRGDDVEPMDIRRNDELGELSRVFRQMHSNLRANRERLLAQRQNLEDEVAKRTRELVKSKDAAEEASRTKSAFLATMSHEIRTPMNGVLGMTELLLDADLSERARRLAANAHRSAESLLTVINDILDYSKIEAGRLELVEEDFDLRELLEDTLELLAESAHRKGLELIADIPHDLHGQVRGDAVRLRQVLVNLLGNAVKFTAQGEVRLVASVSADPAGGCDVKLSVIDTGPGIEESLQSHIFDAFTQADASTTRRHSGTGLGLAIVKQLVDLMGGTVTLRSVIGQGACFDCRVPLRAGHARATSDQPPEQLQDLRALIVDHRAVNRRIFHEQLRAWGMPNECVGSAFQALRHLRQAGASGAPFRLVLLDQDMPDGDGLELVAAIRESEDVPQPRLILLRRGGGRDLADVAPRYRIDGILDKPVRRERLRSCLLRLRGEATEAPSASPPSSARRYHARVLLAEDNRVNEEVAVGMLEALGASVQVAHTGKEAVESYAADACDLVFMDCYMPEMDGFSAATAIRGTEERERRQRVPIIALTADRREGTPQRCIAAGMDDYLSKPFKRKTLRTMLRNWLPAAEDTPEATEALQHPHERAAEPDAMGLLDESLIRQLRDAGAGSGRDILGNAIAAYLQTAPDDLGVLRQAAARQDSETVRRIAHSLKSASMNLGATAFAELCAAAEAAARDGRLEEAHRRIHAMGDALPAVLRALREQPTLVLPKPLPIPFQGAGEGQTILLVDDDARFRSTAGEALTAERFAIKEAANGAEAIAACRENAPELVLLDYLMPDMDGFETCRQLRLLPSMKHVPILMVTGTDDLFAVRSAFTAGANGFEIKPLNYPVTAQRIGFQLRAAADARALRELTRQLAATQHMARLGYWRWDERRDLLVLSEQLAEICGLGYRQTEITLAQYLEHVHPEDRNDLRQQMEAFDDETAIAVSDYRLLDPDGRVTFIHQEIGRAEDETAILLGTVQDVTRQRESQERIRQLAYEDTLTGLASRAYLQLHLENRVKAHRRHAAPFALFYLDLDAFKDVNDSLGHDAGDRLLQIVAQRLKDELRASDFAARLGGDEFCVLLDGWGDDVVLGSAAERYLRAINEPVDLVGRLHQPRASLGIARFPADAYAPQALLKAADSAMYVAKSSGKHRYAFYAPKLTAQAGKRLQLENDLRTAIEDGQLELLYLPKVDLQDGRLSGVEALVRWRHPEHGLLAADEFIETAERIRIIERLDRWVLTTACRQLAEWRRQGLPDFELAVNISPTHFQNPELLPFVVASARDNGLSPTDLELELTERSSQVDFDLAARFRAFGDRGIRLALDDFGSGCSSMASIVNLPINCLKIDRQFIGTMLKSRTAASMVGAVVSLARALGCRVVAEGVETRDEAGALLGIGCDEAQGYCFSKPVPPTRVPALVTTDFFAPAMQEMPGDPAPSVEP
ncbi:EAL domain-containing protein [Thiorhodococcus minor]|uniref:Sensory/regulatory protein RpfC n=1 Tax=Thiorhodococcus minor TaxID=57489 RepID=A0A6M0K222_9GAMM|nr:EAL domain-containing protein [Thiorhodococcus minor]NEV63401.1 EAL domain-containing protein [Thiorhodococcus minor]